MPRIFISYRRDDSRSISGRIYDRLVEAFGEENIFKDVDRIPPGSTFADVLEAELVKCNVLLIIIGQKWVNIVDKDGKRRLDDPADFVRIEVERGLNRPDLLVIPVLVDEVTVPNPADLPDSLDKIASLQVVQVRHDPDFHRDMNRLIDFLKIIEQQKTAIKQREQGAARRNMRRTLAGIAVLVVIMIVGFLALLASGAIKIGSTAEATFDPAGTAYAQVTQTNIAQVAAVGTAGAQASIEAILTQFLTQTQIAGTARAESYTNTPTVTYTPSTTNTPTANATATAAVQETKSALSTQNAQATLDVQATNNALATQNAPTHTPAPTNTPSPSRTPTPSPTPTIAPTETRAPTLTPTTNSAATQTTEAVQLETAQYNAQATQAVGATVKVVSTGSSGTVNLRSGPGTNYSIVDAASRNEVFSVIAQHQDGDNIWYLIQAHSEMAAWVSSIVVYFEGDSSKVEIALTVPAPPPTLALQNANESQIIIVAEGSILLASSVNAETDEVIFSWDNAEVTNGTQAAIIAGPISIHNSDGSDTNWYQIQLSDGRKGWVTEGVFNRT